MIKPDHLIFPAFFFAFLGLLGFKSDPLGAKNIRVMSLYDTIVAMDKKWEDAYNNCRLEIMEELISEDLEFYHDRGGLLTSKKKLNDALKNNICGKVKRILKQGSIEVYEINGYGAVEMGLHGFVNINEQGPPERYSKFIHIWKRHESDWKITRVISLH